jgi:beta-glucosidase
MGQAIGKECNAKGVGILLGPTINLHRSPLGMLLQLEGYRKVQ